MAPCHEGNIDVIDAAFDDWEAGICDSLSVHFFSFYDTTFHRVSAIWDLVLDLLSGGLGRGDGNGYGAGIGLGNGKGDALGIVEGDGLG